VRCFRVDFTYQLQVKPGALRWAVRSALSAVRLAAFALRHAAIAAIAVANVPTIWKQGSAAVAQALTARSRSVRCPAIGPRPGCS